MATYAIAEKAIVLKSEDDVAVAKAPLEAGTVLEDAGARIEVRQDIRPGHKVARRAVHRVILTRMDRCDAHIRAGEPPNPAVRLPQLRKLG